MVDPYTGERRIPVKADLANAAKVVDFLDEIDVCEKAVGSSDVPKEVLPLHNAEAMLLQHNQALLRRDRKRLLIKKTGQNGRCHRGRNKKTQRTSHFIVRHLPRQPLTSIDECCEIIMAAA